MNRLALVFALLIIFAQGIKAQSNNKYALLWRIEGKELTGPSYLFGTMHVKDERAFRFSDSVMVSLEKCQAFAMELHPDTIVKSAFSMLFNNDTVREVDDILSSDEYTKLKKRFREENGYDMDKVNLKNPVLLQQMINRRKSTDKETFVDAYLYGIARTLRKPVYGLEKMKDQLDFFYGMPKEAQRKSMVELINDDSMGIGTLEQMTRIYERGDLFALQKYVEDNDFYNDSLMTRRNHVMVREMLVIMKDKSLFTAVGAAHLPGKNGIIDLLQQLGYTLTPVQATFTGLSDQYSINHSLMDWVTYTDSTMGYKLDAPGELIPANIYPGLNSVVYTDLSNGVTYGSFVINLQGSGISLSEDVTNKIIKTYRKSDEMEIIKKKKFTRNGLSGTELVLKTDQAHMRMQFIVYDNIFYCLFLGNNLNQIYKPYAEKFFQSFTPYKVVKRDPKWVDFVQKQGAFKIQFPSQPKTTVREESTDTGEEEGEYMVNTYMSSDMKDFSNYFVQFNDFPEGRYLNNKDEVFSLMTTNLTMSNPLIGDVDTIWQDGIKGIGFAVMLDNTYPTGVRIFVRGNRVYLLLAQLTKANQDKVKNNQFFDSFSLIPYQEGETFAYKSEDSLFEVMMPGKPKVKIDSVIDYTSQFGQTVDCYITNKNTGGTYQFEYSELQPYFRVNDLDSFYRTTMDNLLEMGDSIIQTDKVNIDGKPGREFLVFRQGDDHPQRIRLWIAGKNFFYSTVLTGKEELFSPMVETFFTSYHDLKVEPFDIYISKFNTLVNHLTSSDTIIQKSAKGALEYYNFTADEIPLLKEALSKTYDDDSLSDGVRNLMLTGLAGIKGESTVHWLKEFYHTLGDNHELKSAVLVAIAKQGKGEGLPVYLDLLVNQPPLDKLEYTYKTFSPLRDSLTFVLSNIETIIKLAESETYRHEVLFLINNMEGKPGIPTGFASPYIEKLTAKVLVDLDKFIAEREEKGQWHYSPQIYSYLELMKVYDNCLFTDPFTNEIMMGSEEYIKKQAVAVRIIRGLPVSKKMIESQFKDLESRHSIMEAYLLAGREKEIPSKYTKQPELAKLCLYDYLLEDGGDPDKITLLGTFKENDSLFYVYSFLFKWEEGNSEYLGVAGPYPAKADLKWDFEHCMPMMDWEQKEKDWKAHARRIIAEWSEE